MTETRHLKGQKKAIQDIATWMEAFLLFATIRNRSHPDHTNDLLVYGALIVKGAKDYKDLGWLAYDYQFCWLAAARGNLGNWGQRDVSLWNDTVCKPYTYEVQKPLPQSNEATTKDSKGVKRKVTTPLSGYKKPRTPGREKQWKASVCYPFSYSGKCSRENCEFLHICYDCVPSFIMTHSSMLYHLIVARLVNRGEDIAYNNYHCHVIKHTCSTNGFE